MKVKGINEPIKAKHDFKTTGRGVKVTLDNGVILQMDTIVSAVYELVRTYLDGGKIYAIQSSNIMTVTKREQS